MKANEFVKKFGITKASKLVIGYPNVVVYKFYNYDFEKEQGKHDEVCLVDIKRLVESHELVEEYGGLDKAKEQAERFKLNTCIKMHGFMCRIIADVESCQ